MSVYDNLIRILFKLPDGRSLEEYFKNVDRFGSSYYNRYFDNAFHINIIYMGIIGVNNWLYDDLLRLDVAVRFE